MGFFLHKRQKKFSEGKKGFLSTDFIRKSGCKACPLNERPEVQPAGSDEPDIYILGEAPGKTEVQQEEPFVGKSGRRLRSDIPNHWKQRVRYGNVVWKHPPDNRTPTKTEIEACRSRVEEDIVDTKPKAIFGMGNVPLAWAIGHDEKGISSWRGRALPIMIRDHVCWFFPMLHPSFVIREKDKERGRKTQFDTVFNKDIQRAMNVIRKNPEPILHSHEDAIEESKRCDYYYGNEDYEEFCDRLFEICRGTVVAFDIETNGLRPYKNDAKILTIAISSDNGNISFALHHRESKWRPSLRNKVFDATIQALKMAEGVICHNASFEIEWMAYFGGKEVAFDVKWDDTMAQAFLLDERRGMHDMDTLCHIHFGLKLKDVMNLDRTRIDSYSLPKVLQYNVLDTIYTLELFLTQWEGIERQDLQDLYEDHVLRARSASLMQLEGLPHDAEKAKSLKKQYEEDLRKATKKIHADPAVQQYKESFGKEFDPDSPKQVGEILHDILEYSLPTTDAGNITTKDEVLQEVDHPIAQSVLDIRHYSKLISTYINKSLPGGDYVWPDGKFHPVFHTMSARTGRLSAEYPPIQQFPKHENKEVRSLIAAPKNHWVLAIDYGSIEVRVIAMVSGDEILTKYLWEGYDMHGAFAEKIFSTDKSGLGRSEDLKDKDKFKTLRYYAKNRLVFAMFFGSSINSCARSLQIEDEKTIKWLEDQLWSEFPGVKQWQKDSLQNYLRTGEVVSLTGRRRRGPFEKYNTYLNTQIQSVAGDLLQDAMNRISWYSYDTEQPWLHPICSIHDELLWIIPDSKVDESLDQLNRLMLKSPFDFVNVPLLAEPEIGPNWAEMEELGEFWSTDFE